MIYDFEPTKISREFRYTLGKETTTERYYLSFLVSPPTKRYVEYEEYYEISFEQINIFLNDEQNLLKFIEDCRRGKNNELMTFYPKASS
ncbi:hypothetical protein PSAR109036_10565 [Psychrobacter arenosus]|uniref:hypothetical protein n=1 Tax=Psychrobacter arenosus TaxID=256326 RepID=UPI001918A2B0|nr:hypothetical protein [Psychrobacter arenosus]